MHDYYKSGRDPHMEDPVLEAKISADYGRLVASFTHKAGDRALAEDIVNDALLASLQKLAMQQIADPTRFSGYVYGVAANLLRNHRRLMDNRPDLRADAAALDAVATATSPADEHFRDCVALQVRRLVDELPVARDRELIRRFYLQGQCKHAICRELGLTHLNFDRIAFRARRRMKALMNAHGLGSADLQLSLQPMRL